MLIEQYLYGYFWQKNIWPFQKQNSPFGRHLFCIKRQIHIWIILHQINSVLIYNFNFWLGFNNITFYSYKYYKILYSLLLWSCQISWATSITSLIKVTGSKLYLWRKHKNKTFFSLSLFFNACANIMSE